MFFEGSEKKAEVIINDRQLSLLDDVNDEFWARLVSASNARILSCIKNESCKAYLLSESSLFVWHDRFLILTCGVTQLVNSIEFFIHELGINKIEQVTYQRKNEYFSHAQPSCFGDDAKRLAKYVSGKAYRFGPMDSHHNYLFHQDNHFRADINAKSYQLLAYQISRQASALLTTKNLAVERIRDFFCLDEILAGFTIDDFVFQPFGYSLNAIFEDQYLTIHVTPQADSSYVSFEANFDLITLATKILAILQPASFDLLSFNELSFAEKVVDSVPQDYISKSLVSEKLSNGYQVHFANFIREQVAYTRPIFLDIAEENHTL
ncbi:adenosylmethionine decarboxylase [Colwelliaceae bacterium 6471]